MSDHKPFAEMPDLINLRRIAADSRESAAETEVILYSLRFREAANELDLQACLLENVIQ
jgi:hypothetical protein